MTSVQKAGHASMMPKKQVLEQYFSSMPVARMMASMMGYQQRDIRILDPGAGAGALFSACIDEICSKAGGPLPDSISVTAYEIDGLLSGHLDDAMGRIGKACRNLGIRFSGNVIRRDFIADCAGMSGGFTHVIMNPPYKKINVSSEMYRILDGFGMQTTNMYAAFIAMACNLLEPDGQITFISPRSFCNGAYFCNFRKRFLESMSPRRIHLFDSRTQSFREDGVLQENVIIYAEKTVDRMGVTISSSAGPDDNIKQMKVRRSGVVFDDDPQRFIHIAPDRAGMRMSSMIRGLDHTIHDIGIGVSTGKVVDFRIREALRFGDSSKAVPLVRPFNICRRVVDFPVESRKHHNFIITNKRSKRLLVENGTYVLVKRFTTKEETRRIVASVWTGDMYDSDLVGFENRINYFHANGRCLENGVAAGLWAFLNSTIVDMYFRQFNGSTQVNATDLRYIRYPSIRQLRRLGREIGKDAPFDQGKIDSAVARILFGKEDVVATH